jgi:hypothetical protein
MIPNDRLVIWSGSQVRVSPGTCATWRRPVIACSWRGPSSGVPLGPAAADVGSGTRAIAVEPGDGATVADADAAFGLGCGPRMPTARIPAAIAATAAMRR